MQYIDELISIVIITCNRKKELKRAVDSCIKFSDMNCEIIIVDNNSIDGTKKLIKNIITPAHIQLRPFFMNNNLRIAGGRNYGFNMANSRVVFFLDDDAYFAENSAGFKYAYNYILKNCNIFALATEIYDLKKNHFLKDICDKKNPKKVFSFVGAGHFIRKDYVKTKDLYPEKLSYGSEEKYVCLGAYDRGFNIEYNPKIKIMHKPSNSTRSNDYENLQNIVINKYINKKLRLPIKLQWVSTIFFYLRLIKLCKLNLKKYYKCYCLFKKSFDENKYATNRISLKTASDLIKRFGIRRIL